MMKQKYVLITPAKNEGDIIPKTIESVIKQTIKPVKWIIVDDNSTDNTRDIVKNLSREYEFINLLTINSDETRNFGSKVNAFMTGYNVIKEKDFDYIGNLDADVSFESTYFERLLNEFNKNKKLGLAGGWISELINKKYTNQIVSDNSVAGAVQFFRRICFEEIGGYTPLISGGIDTVAEVKVRMNGWEVKTIRELIVLHNRPVSEGKNNIFKSRFQQGINHYVLGYHPIFYFFATSLRVLERPIFFGSMLKFFGFLCAAFLRMERNVDDDYITFLRKEQLNRLLNYLPHPFKKD